MLGKIMVDLDNHLVLFSQYIHSVTELVKNPCSIHVFGGVKNEYAR
jgi:hypothetical protein